jgi:hypothetical protein
MAKWNTTSSQRSFHFSVTPTGALIFYRSATGGTGAPSGTSTALVGVADGVPIHVRVTHRVSDGRTQFFTSTDGTAWTQLGADRTVSAASGFNSNAAITIGAISAGNSNLLSGKVYSAELRAGIDGTIIQSFDATAVTVLGTRNPSSVAAGGPWTVNGTTWDWATAAP